VPARRCATGAPPPQACGARTVPTEGNSGWWAALRCAGGCIRVSSASQRVGSGTRGPRACREPAALSENGPGRARSVTTLQGAHRLDASFRALRGSQDRAVTSAGSAAHPAGRPRQQGAPMRRHAFSDHLRRDAREQRADRISTGGTCRPCSRTGTGGRRPGNSATGNRQALSSPATSPPGGQDDFLHASPAPPRLSPPVGWRGACTYRPAAVERPRRGSMSRRAQRRPGPSNRRDGRERRAQTADLVRDHRHFGPGHARTQGG
jgi:hypothetical protein